MRAASFGPTPLARPIIALSPWLTARASSSGESADRIASASLPPTPWTEVSARKESRSTARAEAEQGPGVLAYLKLGEDQHLAAHRSERVERACADVDQISDARDVDDRRVGANFCEGSCQAGDHIRLGLSDAAGARQVMRVGDRDGECVGGIGARDLRTRAGGARPSHGPALFRRCRCRPRPSSPAARHIRATGIPASSGGRTGSRREPGRASASTADSC